MKFAVRAVAFAGLALCAAGAFAQKGETVKIAWIDPLSGLMAPVGSNQLKSFQFFAEKFSQKNPAGVKFEVIGLDNKLSPAESLNALKTAMDQGVRYITQGNGSSVAGALIEAVNKHNERNPGKEVIFLNHSAVDPDFTNSKCSYWHFRFDADTSMKIEAMTTFMKDDKDIKKVYLFNQNYSHGQRLASALMCRSSAKICIPWPKYATLRPTLPKSRLRAQTRSLQATGALTWLCWSKRPTKAATTASSTPITPA
jgi:branched-chain amino acid transport system substrate-binding protein